MPKKVNGPQNKEQLKLLIDVVKSEVDLAQDLLNSYQNDLAQLESDSTISEKEKASKRVFLETAIKESAELLNIRQKQLKSIDPMKGGKKAVEARREAWNDKSLESKGMNAIVAEKYKAGKEQKHNEVVQKNRQETQTKSDDARNVVASEKEPTKLTEEKLNTFNKENTTYEPFIPRPDFIQGSAKWELLRKSTTNNAYIFRDENNIKYIFFPEIGEVIKNEMIRGKLLSTYFDVNTNTWNLVPNEIMIKEGVHFNAQKNQWLPYDFEQGQWENNDLEENWQVPEYDEDGNLLHDELGRAIFTTTTDEEMTNKYKEEKEAQMAKQIEEAIIGENSQTDSNKDERVVYGKNQVHLNWIQKLKQWFMRLFNKNYMLPGKISNDLRSTEDMDGKILYKAKEINKSKELNNEKYVYRSADNKRIIKGFNIPKVKQFFKDNKNRILAISALSLATLATVFGINARKAYNKNIIEQRASEAQKEADLEAKRAEEEKQALVEAAKKQEQEQLENEQDKLVAHDVETLTSGTLEKQYVARGGLEYTADSTGRGTKGTLANDTVVEIFNRAIVKENEDGTKEILLSSNGKTWEDYAKDTGKSIDEIKNMLKQDKTYEMAAIQVGGTNHSIFNTYGWVKTADLDESSKGTENLKDFEVTTGDNTKILQQLQEKENTNRINQNTQEER